MNLSVVVITKNNKNEIKACLESVKQANEIIVVDDFSTDDTIKIAQKYTNKIFQHKLESFPSQRNYSAGKVTSDWFIFLDSDERLTKKNWQEINTIIKTTSHAAFRFKRQNYFSGQKIRHGGFWPDYQTRLFKRSSFKSVKGVSHEQYLFDGTLGTLEISVPHFPNRSIVMGLKKSIMWTPAEAQALFKANHPPITWWRILKVILSEFFYRYFKKQGFRDGYIGFTEGIIQSINKFFIYQQVWELQNEKKIL
ncbi:MAG: glycosyltransferase family 2 protein [Candidatus Beckwithbacteria bacterium]